MTDFNQNTTFLLPSVNKENNKENMHIYVEEKPFSVVSLAFSTKTEEEQIFHIMSVVTDYAAGFMICTSLKQVVNVNSFYVGWLTKAKIIPRYSSHKTQMNSGISASQNKSFKKRRIDITNTHV